MEPNQYYKFLLGGGYERLAGKQWFLPGEGPGKWMPKKPNSTTRDLWYHGHRPGHLIMCMKEELYVMEVRGETMKWQYENVVAQEARLLFRVKDWSGKTSLPTISRLFGCDCAERAQPPTPNPQSLNAIRVARDFAHVNATRDHLGAARKAAWEAAWGDERTAAGAAAWYATNGAAWDAGRGASWQAVNAAARGLTGKAMYAAWAAESAQQEVMLADRLDRHLKQEGGEAAANREAVAIPALDPSQP